MSGERLPDRLCGHCGATASIPRYEVSSADGTAYHIVECSRCGLVRLRELLSDAEYRDLYRGGTSTIHVADELTIATYDSILEDLARFRSTGKLLEVGIGGGSFVRRAAVRGWSCFGNDVSNVDFQHLADVIPSEHLHRGPLESAPFAASSMPVDAVVMLEVLEHIPSFATSLDTIRGVLRPGGALFLTVPNYASVSRRVLGAKAGGWDVPHHVSFFSPRTMRMVLERAGFHVEKLWTSGLNPLDFTALIPRRRSTGSNRGPAAPAVNTPEYRASRLARRQRIDMIRRAVAQLGPIKPAINRGLDLFAAGDSLKCLAVAQQR